METRRYAPYMPLILIIIILLLVFGGGGLFVGRGRNWRAPHYGGGLVGLIVLILLVLWLTGNLGGHVIR